jgi:hypothetical protein
LLYKNTKVKVYATIILPVVLYGCGTWSLPLREKHRPSMFENRVPRKVFGSKREEATGDWRRLHNEGLRDLYCSPNIIRVIKRKNEMVGACSTYKGIGEAHTEFWWGNVKQKDQFDDLTIDGRILLKLIIKK